MGEPCHISSLNNVVDGIQTRQHSTCDLEHVYDKVIQVDIISVAYASNDDPLGLAHILVMGRALIGTCRT